jgi:hypothetical protein
MISHVVSMISESTVYGIISRISQNYAYIELYIIDLTLVCNLPVSMSFIEAIRFIRRILNDPLV